MVKLDVFEPDPLLGDDGNDVVPPNDFFALSGQIVDAELDVRQTWTRFVVSRATKLAAQFALTGQEAEEEDANASDLAQNPAALVLLDEELVDSRHLHFVRFVPHLRLRSWHCQLEKGLFNRTAELFHLFVIGRAKFEQLRYLQSVSLLSIQSEY